MKSEITALGVATILTAVGVVLVLSAIYQGYIGNYELAFNLSMFSTGAVSASRMIADRYRKMGESKEEA